MGEKLSTGIDAIDRQMAGGIRPGSLLAIVAGPTMQSEALIHKMLEMRPTLYLSTLRRPSAVEDDLSRLPTDEVFVEAASKPQMLDNDRLKELTGTRTYTSSFLNQDKLLDRVYEMVRDVNEQANVVIDSVNPLEETDQKSAYRDVLNELKSTMLETGGVGILHCITLEDSPPFRDVTLTLADVVWELNLASLSNKLEYQMTIPKNRGGAPVLDETSIVIDSDIWVDESRNI
jgi:KaiC/GvpD/RAD55 family RecA-like ATPase